LMIALPVIVIAEICDRVPQHFLAEEDHPAETLGFYRSHEPFRNRAAGSPPALAGIGQGGT
jgi:hypothetical protein